MKRICRRARRLGYTRLALTDTDNLYGLWPFLAACRREGITPIVGAEVTDPRRTGRAVCLVENHAGFANLCRLLTRRHMNPDFDLKRDAAALADGLVVLTRDPDLLLAWHRAGVTTAGAMPRRPLPASHRLRRTARELGVRCVATPGSFFLDPGDLAAHRMLRAIQRNTSLSRVRPGDMAPRDAWLAGPGEYARRFAICPEAVRETRELARRLAFTGPSPGLIMPPLENSPRRDTAELLRKAAYEGAEKRYGQELPEPVVERLEHELRVIVEMGFHDYFLIVRDIVARSPRTCGRGSGAASLVGYCLGVSNVCPIKHNLYFERFLNPGRTDPPDIDVDFAWDERDDVLNDVLTRRRGHAAMVASHVLFQPRMALRETAKVYGLGEGEIKRISDRLPYFWRAGEAGVDLREEIEKRPRSKFLEFPPPWPEVLEQAGKILGAPRYLSVHPGGVVITPGPIDAYVPVERAPKGVPVIQWEKDGAEAAGLVKIDLLGNRSLGVIRDAVANIRDNGVPFDETRWEPEDDFDTQETLARGGTMGCFYIESPAMRQLQQKSGRGDFEHVVIHTSIIRPAANEYIQEYLRRLHGGEWDPIHPLLADVLDETFGIMVYQEDVSRTAVSLAGFSPAEADGLRKILSKKDRERALRDYRRRFTEGARSKGVPDEKIVKVWDMIMSFSGYSFCKPHSASYTRVSFQSAWLKTHFPAEFIAAVISNRGGFYSTFAYVSEARRMGLAILPPDVNESEAPWTGRESDLRVGLISIKGLSGGARERIVSERKRGSFMNMSDFLSRIRPDEAEARALILCGALDGMSPGQGRAALMWELAIWRRARMKQSKTRSLFADGSMAEAPPLPPDDERERLRREFAVLGFLCDRHPMELYASSAREAGAVKAVELPRFQGKRVRMAGWLVTGKIVRTKRGEPMQFLTFEDETGIVETTFFPRAYSRFSHMIDRGRPYLLSGKVEQDWGAATLTVDSASPLPIASL